jgi:hypothetical protein
MWDTVTLPSCMTVYFIEIAEEFLEYGSAQRIVGLYSVPELPAGRRATPMAGSY